MPPPSLPAERLQKLFHRRGCWLLADLSHVLGYALISVRRFFKEIGYCRSYTHNGKWYTLRSTPRFDRDGIWHYKDIGFSSRGSLIATIDYLVGRSPAGLSARELAQKLQHPYHSVLTNLHKAGTLDRVKLGGEFRYLSTAEETNRRQREQAAAAKPASGSLRTHAAVLVLVEYVKHPARDFEQLAASLRRREALSVEPEAIRRFFEEQGLKKNGMTDAKTLNVLERYLEKIATESSARHLFPQRPVLSFRPALRRCKNCRAILKIGKTRTKTVTTRHLGSFTAHETLLPCPRCHTIHGAEQLSRLAPAGCTFGYDVMIFAGKALFLRRRTAAETVEELRQGNVRISPSEVAYLAKKFVVYLALAHRQCAPRLNALLRGNGGYILHLDATCEGGGPMLMSSLDSLSQIVLGHRKVPSEKAAEIIPLLQQIKARHGSPAGIVHDMGTGIRAAVDQVFPGIPDFICHFHFLRDLGKDLLAADYDSIRACLRQHALAENLQTQARRLQPEIDREPGLIHGFCQCVDAGAAKNAARSFPRLCAYSLIQWVLEGKKQGDGFGFPFDRPHLHLAKRALLASTHLASLDALCVPGAWKDSRPLFQLSWALRNLRADSALQKAMATKDGWI